MKCLVELFKDRVLANPNAIALEDSTVAGVSQRLTYQELDILSDRLGTELTQHGVSATEVVPILSGRCTGSVIAILAVLKLRACYVPMDIDTWGADRLESTLDRVKPTLIITTKADVLSKASEQYHLLYIRPDGSGFEFLTRQVDPTNTPRNFSLQSQHDCIEEDWAYMIFTSGSTGKPKGVIVKQKSISTLVTEHDPHLPFNLNAGLEDRVLLIFSFAFDGKLSSRYRPSRRKLISEYHGQSMCIRHLVYAVQWGHPRSVKPYNIGGRGGHLLNMDHHAQHPLSHGPDKWLQECEMDHNGW